MNVQRKLRLFEGAWTMANQNQDIISYFQKLDRGFFMDDT